MRPSYFLSALAFIAVIAGGCRKTVDSPAQVQHASLGKIYKDSVAGIWSWEHINFWQPAAGPGVQTLLANDTFAVIILNDSMVAVKGINLTYSDSLHYTATNGRLHDTANTVNYYKGYYSDTYRYDLSFNRHNDSLIFSITQVIGNSRNYETYRTKIN